MRRSLRGLALLPALFVRNSHGFSASNSQQNKMPMAAARRLEIARLEEELAALKAASKVTEARFVRKRLNSLRRSEPPSGSEVFVATFFRFGEISNAEARAARLRNELDALQSVLGSVVVSAEGVNGALSAPEPSRTSVEAAVSRCLPFDISLNWAAEATRSSPFLALRVKTKAKALADGLEEDFDWSDCGEELEAADWHQALVNEDSVVLDFRNDYETALGKFEGAQTLETKTFAETWGKLDAALADVDASKPVYMYCTGGVRCVKGGAYVKQKLGLSRVYRLKDGIVGYERWLKSSQGQVRSRFEGTNFVFDRRQTTEEP